ncbi:MAG TPA: 50S ribosomal protein L15e [Candidatus Lokiarchaeia archaeon]|nr:50S ribosomal protein L15e [Candidatus Lokiarchaeia archaeon]
MSMYRHLGMQWESPSKTNVKEENFKRLILWRRQPTVVRIDKPTRVDRARSLGYKAKQGFVVTRVKVRRGTFVGRIRPWSGRQPTKMGVNKLTCMKSLRWIGEQRAQKRYPNLEVLGSYWVAQDGHHKFFEVIMVDPVCPVIIADPHINWICQSTMKGRVYRGLTGAGKKARDLRHRGIGAEKVRPSGNANDHLGK